MITIFWMILGVIAFINITIVVLLVFRKPVKDSDDVVGEVFRLRAMQAGTGGQSAVGRVAGEGSAGFIGAREAIIYGADTSKPAAFASQFRVGDLVEVRSMEEILPELDVEGRFENLPFMPEMLAFAGSTFKVEHRLEQIGGKGYIPRFWPKTVTLKGVFCNGSAHDCCGKKCQLLWKDVWLKPADPRKSVFERQGMEAASGFLKMKEHHYLCQSRELEKVGVAEKVAG